MTNLSIFAFEGQQVRFVGTAEDPEWIAADVCSILDLNTSLVINGRPDRPDSGLDFDEKGIAIVNTPGGEQEMLMITEPGLYRLLSKSRKSIAKRFQRSQSGEVIYVVPLRYPLAWATIWNLLYSAGISRSEFFENL